MGASCLPDVMIIKLDTLAVPVKLTMSAQTSVEINVPSPSLEKKEEKISSNSYMWENGRFGRMGEGGGWCSSLSSSSCSPFPFVLR